MDRNHIPDYLAPEYISVSLKEWDRLREENEQLKARVRKLERILKGEPNG